MQMRPRNFRLIAVAASATIIIGVSAFAPPKEAALTPRFNHVMLVVSNLDSSIAFYTTAFDLQVAQRITELSDRRDRYDERAACEDGPAEVPAAGIRARAGRATGAVDVHGSRSALPAPRRRRPGYRSGRRSRAASRRAGSRCHPDREYVRWNGREEHVLPRAQRRADRADASRVWRVLIIAGARIERAMHGRLRSTRSPQNTP